MYLPDAIAKIDALRVGECWVMEGPRNLPPHDYTKPFDPCEEAMPPRLTVRRILNWHGPRRFEVSLPGGWKCCDHAETLVEVQRFLKPPARENPQWTAEELAALGRPDGVFEPRTKPLPQFNKIKPPAEHLAQLDGMMQSAVERAGAARMAELVRQTAWAVDVALGVWPKPVWDITTPITPFVHVPSLRWSIYPERGPLLPIASEEIPLFPALAPATLARLVAGVRDNFFDNFKLANRETRKSAAAFEVGTWQGMIIHYAAEPADRIAAAFALPLPGDADELHDRLFVGPRAGMEDVRNGR